MFTLAIMTSFTDPRLREYSLPMLGAVLVYASALWYHGFASRHGIVARLNSRTLHTKVVPRGAGVVVGAVFALLTSVGWGLGFVSTPFLLAFGVGGAGATLAGFADDVLELSARRKLAIHGGLALWLLTVWYQPVYASELATLTTTARLLAIAGLVFIPMWLVNVYNFVDGIDGMAMSGAVFICIAALLALRVAGADEGMRFILTLLGCCSFGLLFLNLPPARMFMGDAGSMFLGYAISAAVIWTVLRGHIGVWTWLVLLGYFIGDTTTTTLCRMVLVRRWYGVHRSHAYQNLARTLNSHARVTYGVALYHVFWVLPLALWSVLRQDHGPFAAALSLGPAVLLTLKFGPRLSSD